MFEELEIVLQVGLIIGQLLFAAVGSYALLSLLPKRPLRWSRLAFLSWRTASPPERWLRLLRVDRESAAFREREMLLAGCGVTADPAWYVLARGIAIGAFIAVSLAALAAIRLNAADPVFQLMAGAPALLAGLLYGDRIWLRTLRQLRALQITKEIYTVSNQLLYLSESTLHIHAKLTRCVPFAKAMKTDMERLLAEWYHDPAIALQRFKARLGTDDGMSFVETLDALRLHESSQYYELLRVRIADYKDKLELAKEGRKESTSYILFLLAGIPILYTFQVFIFPWIREGQKLFESLG
ncbi:hypothetical protein RB620_25740 [Paenibacillus sp. LHD-117]|uniref:hypothetical protein n=1 Tax=Paenibacillus sp. LHD-117 TaxID=3071412 RepID=UPI0027DF09F7|nr:hypothetical protein [Paenibacillus sp. LHD-117]MDQ6422834.1 hypothetical protein [Paenibacillus sp. LHD-117]